MPTLDHVLTSVSSLRAAIGDGLLGVPDIAAHVVRRIAALDRDGPRLGAVPVLDPELLLVAERLGSAGARGELHGVPVTVKDSFAVAGLAAAAGSPAFATVRARRDAVVVHRLRQAGALVVGKTTMPPMAIGGGQPGVDGRVRSPYNPDWLPAAWHSGSSIGSAVSVAAGMASVGIGEETVSSGRSPAANNAVVAYTPSWGVIPSVGNWPLHPFRDVVVPHTRDVSGLLTVLRVIAGGHEDDPWARQRALDMRGAQEVAAHLRSGVTAVSLDGLRVGVPRLYLGQDYADVRALPLRPSIARLWDAAVGRLVEAGARIELVDLPVVEAYEGRSAHAVDLERAGYLSREWTAYELGPLMTFGWQRYLDDFCDGDLRLADVNPYVIRPDPPSSLDAIQSGRRHPGRDVFDYAGITRGRVPTEAEVLARAEPALQGLDAARRDLFEDWMDQRGLDVVAFPANSDIAPWNADTDPAAARSAWADGTVFSSTNHVLRRLGIPSVTLPMGLMADTAMPAALTIAGPAGHDARLLGIATTLERLLPPRPHAPLPPVDPEGRPDLLTDLDDSGRLRRACTRGVCACGPASARPRAASGPASDPRPSSRHIPREKETP